MGYRLKNIKQIKKKKWKHGNKIVNKIGNQSFT